MVIIKVKGWTGVGPCSLIPESSLPCLKTMLLELELESVEASQPESESGLKTLIVL